MEPQPSSIHFLKPYQKPELHRSEYIRLWLDLLAVVSMVSYRVWQPARLVVQPVEVGH